MYLPTRQVLIGMILGATCATAPSIYVDVPAFRSWISGYAGTV